MKNKKQRLTHFFACIACITGLLLNSSQLTAQTNAIKADDFVASIGINVNNNQPTFAQFFQLERSVYFPMIGALGVRYVRQSTDTGSINIATELYNKYGVKALLGTGRMLPSSLWPEQKLDTSQINQEITDMKKIPVSAIIAIEGTNEYDLMHGTTMDPTWWLTLRNYFTTESVRIRSDAVLKNIPIIGPALTSEAAEDSVGNLDPYIDYAGLHIYVGGFCPEEPAGTTGARIVS